MSIGYQNRASEVAYFIDFNFTFFTMFKSIVLLIVDLEFLKLVYMYGLKDNKIVN